MKCLIADASTVTRRAIAGALRPLGGPDLLEADTVEAACAACDDTVELVVAGWSENGFDGLELARRLRARGTPGAPRIVIVSPRNQRARVLEAAAIGIDAYVLRPFDPEFLRGRVERLLAPAAEGPAAAEPVPAAKSASPPAEGDRQAA
jgi:two-component system chemotaxis response regulator CheY